MHMFGFVHGVSCSRVVYAGNFQKTVVSMASRWMSKQVMNRCSDYWQGNARVAISAALDGKTGVGVTSAAMSGGR